MTPLQQIGRYSLIRRLAQGGMGEVYLADIQGAAGFSRQVVLKRILPHLRQETEFIQKFIDEAQIMVQLHHGNIVRVEELTDEGGELCIVMEYLPGCDLRAITKRLQAARKHMPTALAVWLLTEICAGLDYAHRKLNDQGKPLHIVHRDISPSNVLLGFAGEVKLTDFGVASARGCLHASMSGTLQGKVLYMSPEQGQGERLDGRSDLFSAGLILYELLTNMRPFQAESELEQLRRVRECDIPPIEAYAPGIDSELVEIVHKSLEANPDDRYQTAAEFSRALLEYLVHSNQSPSAADLGAYLRELFPEGATAEQAPMSLDEALQLGLSSSSSQEPGTWSRPKSGAFSTGYAPQSNDFTVTNAADEKSGTPSVKLHSFNSNVSPSHPSAQRLFLLSQPSSVSQNSNSAQRLENSQEVPLTPEQLAEIVRAQSGRKQFVIKGNKEGELTLQPARTWRYWLIFIVPLFLAASMLSIFYHEHSARQPKEGEIEVHVFPEGLKNIQITAQGKPLGKKTPAEQWSEICAQALGYEPQCQDILLKNGEHRTVEFTLIPKPVLEVELVPAEVRADITVNGVQVALPYDNLKNGAYVSVCAVLRDERFRSNETMCRQIQVHSGQKNTLTFTFEAIPPVDAGVLSESDAAPKIDSGIKSSTKNPPKINKPEVVVVESSPAGAQIDCGTAKGVSPLTVTISQSKTCTATLAHYAPTSATVSRGDKKKTIQLAPLARLSVRAEPGSAWISIDGKRVAQGVFSGEIPPGSHDIRVRLEIGGQLLSEKSAHINLSAGGERHLFIDATPAQ